MPGGWLLSIDGVASSFIHVKDPRYLDFEYVRWIGDVIDALPDGTLEVVHLGGGGCTLPRYVAATRPGSDQLVIEYDEKLISLVQQWFPLPAGVHVKVGEANAEVAELPARSCDVLIRDAFCGPLVPMHLLTTRFCERVSDALREDGLYIANVADRPPLSLARREAATALTVFEHVALIIEPSVLRGRRFGNLVLVASHDELPRAAIARGIGSAAVPGRLVAGGRLTDLIGEARPFVVP